MTANMAKKKATDAQKLGNDFGQAFWSLIARDIIGDKWLAKPLTNKEKQRHTTEYSDYGASYWTTESKGAYGVVRCRCGTKIKRKYPWFGAKHCGGFNE